MAEGDEGPKYVKNDGGIDDAVHVQLSEELDGCNAPLIELENVFLLVSCKGGTVTHFHPNADVFHYLVHHGDGKVGMITLQVVHEASCQTDVFVLGLPDFREGPQNEAVCLPSAGANIGTLTSGSSQCILRNSTRTLS